MEHSGAKLALWATGAAIVAAELLLILAFPGDATEPIDVALGIALSVVALGLAMERLWVAGQTHRAWNAALATERFEILRRFGHRAEFAMGLTAVRETGVYPAVVTTHRVPLRFFTTWMSIGLETQHPLPSTTLRPRHRASKLDVDPELPRPAGGRDRFYPREDLAKVAEVRTDDPPFAARALSREATIAVSRLFALPERGARQRVDLAENGVTFVVPAAALRPDQLRPILVCLAALAQAADEAVAPPLAA